MIAVASDMARSTEIDNIVRAGKAKPAEEPKAEEAKPVEEPKAEEAKPAEEPKAEEAETKSE